MDRVELVVRVNGQSSAAGMGRRGGWRRRWGLGRTAPGVLGGDNRRRVELPGRVVVVVVEGGG